MSIIRDFHAFERFPIPDCFEVFLANDQTGGFEQICGPMEQVVAEEALGAFQKHPEFEGKKLFLVRVERIPVTGNFNPSDVTSRLLVPEKGNAAGRLLS